MKTFLLLLLAAPGAAGATQVYKCEGPAGAVYQNSPCEPDSAPHEVRKDSSFGQSTRSAEISVSGSACVANSAATYANGYLVNHTTEAKTVHVTATFTRRGAVVDTVTLPFDVPSFGRTPFSLIGSRQTSCSLQLAWD